MVHSRLLWTNLLTNISSQTSNSFKSLSVKPNPDKKDDYDDFDDYDYFDDYDSDDNDDDDDDDDDQKRRKSQILNSCPASRSIHRSDPFSNNSTYRKTQLFICIHILTLCSTHWNINKQKNQMKYKKLCFCYAPIFVTIILFT